MRSACSICHAPSDRRNVALPGLMAYTLLVPRLRIAIRRRDGSAVDERDAQSRARQRRRQGQADQARARDDDVEAIVAHADADAAGSTSMTCC